MRWIVMWAAVLAAALWFVMRSPLTPGNVASAPRSVAEGAPAPLPALPELPDNIEKNAEPSETLAEDVAALAYDLSEGAKDRHQAFLDTLRQDRPGATARLIAALEALDDDARGGSPGRMLLHTLGEVGHTDALPTLSEVALAPLPPSQRIDHHIDVRDEAALTRVMALDALEVVAVRYGDRERMAALRAVADALIDTPDNHPNLYATAAGILRRHANDPTAMTAVVEARLPPTLAHLAHLEYTDAVY